MIALTQIALTQIALTQIALTQIALTQIALTQPRRSLAAGALLRLGLYAAVALAVATFSTDHSLATAADDAPYRASCDLARKADIMHGA
jgi:hypothetical protein